MKKKALLIIFFLSSITLTSQEKNLISDLDELKLNIGEVYSPNTYSIDNQGKKYDCERVIYYNKKGTFNLAIRPGNHNIKRKQTLQTFKNSSLDPNSTNYNKKDSITLK